MLWFYYFGIKNFAKSTKKNLGPKTSINNRNTKYYRNNAKINYKKVRPKTWIGFELDGPRAQS